MEQLNDNLKSLDQSYGYYFKEIRKQTYNFQLK